MNAQIKENELYIGQPINTGSSIGHIVAINDNDSNTFLVGAGMQKINKCIDVVYRNFTMSKGIDEHTARRWANNPLNGTPALSVDQIEHAIKRAELKTSTEYQTRMQAIEKKRDEKKAFQEMIKPKIPANAKAVIIAELVVDDSDLMSDYHGSTVEKKLILAWSTHTRDLFKEMRKASLNAPETADLFNAPDDAEHREKYSMGGGYYLKESYRHSNGWKVSKQPLYNGAESVPVGRLCLVEASAPRTTPTSSQTTQTAGQYDIQPHHHTKRNVDIYICVPQNRLERDVFNSERSRCKTFGGWYSRKWGSTPGGFAFDEMSNAEQFAGNGTTDPGKQPTIKQPAGMPVRFRKMATGMETKIEGLRAERLTNTPKRLAQAEHSKQEANHLERTKKALILLADMQENDVNKFNQFFAQYTSKKAIHDVLGAELETVSNGYHAYYIETGKPGRNADKALWDLVGGLSDKQMKQQDLNSRVNALKFMKIPGYFPTPDAVIEKMLDKIELSPGVSVLEPSAGHGSIVDKLLNACDTVRVTAVEVRHSLSEIITLKHCHVEVINNDFMNLELPNDFDYVVMNPPFEKGADVQHIMKAFGHLKSGGTLVAVMSPGFTFRTDNPYSLFNTWLENLTHESEELPAKSFSSSGTNINTVLMTIYKD